MDLPENNGPAAFLVLVPPKTTEPHAPSDNRRADFDFEFDFVIATFALVVEFD